jgi:hypothetical protein
MTLADVEEAVRQLEARGQRPTERAVLTQLGAGSRRDVARFLHLLAEDGQTPGITPGSIVPPEARQDLSDDADQGEPGGDPEHDAGVDDQAQDPWDQDQDAGDDAPPPRTVTPWDRRTTVSEVCELCEESVSHIEMVAVVLSALPSKFDIEFACTPRTLFFHDPCLRQWAVHWCTQAKKDTL